MLTKEMQAYCEADVRLAEELALAKWRYELSRRSLWARLVAWWRGEP